MSLLNVPLKVVHGKSCRAEFDVVVYTNITRDHLKYHKTWNNYALAKSLLITQNLKREDM